MNVKVKLFIANLKSSLAKEKISKYYENYDYTDENLDKVFTESLLNVSEKNRARLDYLKDSMPGLTEMKIIVQDILEFYENHFMSYSLEKTYEMSIRFFLHVKFMHEDGDASGNVIRIGCKNLVEPATGSESFSKFINSIGYKASEYYQNNLRRVLAHEIYHLLHFKHCELEGKKHSNSICENIFDEIFANYFSYNYMLDFLKRTEGKDSVNYNRKRNDIFDWYQDIKCFGVGRKEEFPNYFTNEEIEEDKKLLKELTENEKTKRVVATSHYFVSRAEYAAGCYLAFYEERHREAGKLYDEMYNAYMSGNADEALVKLIRIKEQEYKC